MQNEQDLVGMTFEEVRLILNQIGKGFRVIEEKNLKFVKFIQTTRIPPDPNALRLNLIVDGPPYPDGIASCKSKVVKIMWG